MEWIRWIAFTVWLSLSVLAIVRTILKIKRFHIPNPVSIIFALLLIVLAYGSWLLWVIDFYFAMIYISILLYSALGYLAQKVIEKYQYRYGKHKITDFMFSTTILCGYMGQFVVIIVKGVAMIIFSLFKDMSEEIDRNAKADEAADKYLRDRVSKCRPINYENELESAYRDYIRTTGTEDTSRNHEEFKKKYYNHVFG